MPAVGLQPRDPGVWCPVELFCMDKERNLLVYGMETSRGRQSLILNL